MYSKHNLLLKMKWRNYMAFSSYLRFARKDEISIRSSSTASHAPLVASFIHIFFHSVYLSSLFARTKCVLAKLWKQMINKILSSFFLLKLYVILFLFFQNYCSIWLFVSVCIRINIINIFLFQYSIINFLFATWHLNVSILFNRNNYWKKEELQFASVIRDDKIHLVRRLLRKRHEVTFPWNEWKREREENETRGRER